MDAFWNENNYCSFKYLFKDDNWYCKQNGSEPTLLADALGKPRLTEDIIENKLNEELRIEEDMNFEFIGKKPEAQVVDVEAKDVGAGSPVYADAVRQMRKADEKRAEYTELPKAEEREEAPKFKGSEAQKKMHLSEALFEDAGENEEDDEEDISVKDVLKEMVAKFGNHKYKYKLVAEKYERYTTGSVYTKTFFAPNDYIALFSMMLHKAPTVANFEEYIEGYELKEYLNDYPTFESFLDMAEQCWWGDGDDYIFSLENLTTGETLYAGADFDDDEEDDDAYDFEESVEPDNKEQLEESSHEDEDLEEDFDKKVKSNPKTWDDFYGVFQKHYKVYPSREKDGWFKLQLKTDDQGNQRGNFDAAKEICAKYGLECRATEGPSYKFPYITVFEPKGE